MPEEDRAAYLAEAYKRNLLPPDMKSAYEQAQQRGLLKSETATSAAEAPPERGVLQRAGEAALESAKESVGAVGRMFMPPKDVSAYKGPGGILRSLKETGAGIAGLAAPLTAPAAGVTSLVASGLGAAQRGLESGIASGVGAVSPETGEQLRAKIPTSEQAYEAARPYAGAALSAIRAPIPRVPAPPPTVPVQPGIPRAEGKAAERVVKSFQEALPATEKYPQRFLTPREFEEAKLLGDPVALADLGDSATKALLRKSANLDPMARAEIERMVEQRFLSQNQRAGSAIRSLTGPPADAAKRRAQIQAEYDADRTGAYNRAYSSGDKPIGADDPVIEQLLGAPAVIRAMKGAVTQGKNIAIAEGHGAFRPGATITPDGRVEFAAGKTGVPTYPNLQFWDYTKRQLDRMIEKSKDKLGRPTTLTNTLTTLQNKLISRLDHLVPEYANARGIAATYFGERNAMDSARKIATSPGSFDARDIKLVMNKMKPAERAAFQESHLDAWASKIEGTSDRVDAIKRMMASPKERAIVEAIHGPQGAQRMEMFLRKEAIFDDMRKALGNSTTARQLMELGIGGETKELANLVKPFIPGHKYMSVLEHFSSKFATRMERDIARRVARLLTSDDPRELAQGLDYLAKTPRAASNLRALNERMAALSSAITARPPAPQPPALPPSSPPPEARVERQYGGPL